MASSSSKRRDPSPCLMPWFASLVWVLLGMSCCLMAMLVIMFVLVYWALPHDETARSLPPSPRAEHFPTPAAKHVASKTKTLSYGNLPFKSTSHTRIKCNSASNLPRPPFPPQAPLPSTTSHALPSTTTTTTTTSDVPLSTATTSHDLTTTSHGSLLSTTTSQSHLPSITTSQGIQPFGSTVQAPRPFLTSPSIIAPVYENGSSGAVTSLSGRSGSDDRHLSLSSVSPEGRPSSLSDLKSRIREMLTKVREIDARVLRRDEVLVRRAVREDPNIKK